MTVVLTWLVTFLAMLITVAILPGIHPVGGDYAGPALTAAFLALVNVFIKPFVQILALPLSIFTLGLFALVVNAALLMLAAAMSNGVFRAGIKIDSFGWALLGAAIMSVITALLGMIIL